MTFLQIVRSSTVITVSGSPTPYTFSTRGRRILWISLNFVFSRGPHPEKLQYIGDLLPTSYTVHNTVQHLRDFPGSAFPRWSYSYSNMRARTVTRVSDLVVFTSARSRTNSKVVRAIPDIFVAGLPAPETNLRGMVLGVRMAPNFCTWGLEYWSNCVFG